MPQRPSRGWMGTSSRGGVSVSAGRRSGRGAHESFLTAGRSACPEDLGNLSEKGVAATFGPRSVAFKQSSEEGTVRKKIVDLARESASTASQNWLDLERLSHVEVTSESAERPIESALIPGAGPGWRAEQPGEQAIRIIFDQPHGLRRIFLVFHEEEQPRTQEFVLRWLRDGEKRFRDILRQQYTFGPPDTTREVEDYGVELDGVRALELRIVPDISGGGACATLAQLRLASA